jgi:RHS repeat-associated protein
MTSALRFLYDEWNLVAEFEMISPSTISSLPSPALCATNARGLDLSGTEQGAGGVGGLLCISRATENGQRNTSLPTFDGNGNVLALYDLNSQTLTARYEYGPFGETLVAEGPAAAENAFRFSIKYTDEETGLLYYGYRYYSAELGRWLNRDPIAENGGLNLYGMVGNDAVNLVDVLGLSKERLSVTETFEWEEGGDSLGSVSKKLTVEYDCECNNGKPKISAVKGEPADFFEEPEQLSAGIGALSVKAPTAYFATLSHESTEVENCQGEGSVLLSTYQIKISKLGLSVGTKIKGVGIPTKLEIPDYNGPPERTTVLICDCCCNPYSNQD